MLLFDSFISPKNWVTFRQTAVFHHHKSDFRAYKKNILITEKKIAGRKEKPQCVLSSTWLLTFWLFYSWAISFSFMYSPVADSQFSGFCRWLCSIAKTKYSYMFGSPHIAIDRLASENSSNSACSISNPQSHSKCFRVCLSLNLF